MTSIRWFFYGNKRNSCVQQATTACIIACICLSVVRFVCWRSYRVDLNVPAYKKSAVFFFSKYNFFLSRSSFPTVMATEWKCVDCFDGFKSFLCPYKCIWNLNYTSKRIAHESKQVWIEIMKFTAHHTKEIGLRDYSISGSISMATLGLPSHFPWSITTSWLHVTKW